ncbi:hypothetical protein ABGB16_20815 [Micromonospora sp. B11E3]|uniref:hypothetical protein n=1 Tax=Micromonospora sp. B11E3 TaxID=3153562 RepID=UPI00325C6EC1
MAVPGDDHRPVRGEGGHPLGQLGYGAGGVAGRRERMDGARPEGAQVPQDRDDASGLGRPVRPEAEDHQADDEQADEPDPDVGGVRGEQRRPVALATEPGGDLGGADADQVESDGGQAQRGDQEERDQPGTRGRAWRRCGSPHRAVSGAVTLPARPGLAG